MSGEHFNQLRHIPGSTYLGFFFLLKYKVLCSLGWPQTHCIGEAGLELLTSTSPDLPPHFKIFCIPDQQLATFPVETRINSPGSEKPCPVSCVSEAALPT